MKVNSFTPRPLYYREDESQFPLDRALEAFQNQSGRKSGIQHEFQVLKAVNMPNIM
jgi:hypothetical protein